MGIPFSWKQETEQGIWALMPLDLSRSIGGGFISKDEHGFCGLCWDGGFLGDGPVIGADDIPAGQDAQQLVALRVRNHRQKRKIL
jgi:hypothetical protein